MQIQLKDHMNEVDGENDVWHHFKMAQEVGL